MKSTNCVAKMCTKNNDMGYKITTYTINQITQLEF